MRAPGVDAAVAIGFRADLGGEVRGWGDVRAAFAFVVVKGNVEMRGVDRVRVWVEDFLIVDGCAVEGGGGAGTGAS